MGRKQAGAEFSRRTRVLYENAMRDGVTDPSMVDLRAAELATLFDVYVGNDVSEKKRKEVEHLQREIHALQEELGGKLDAGALTPQDYLNRFNLEAWKFFTRCEEILGRKQFRRLFGGSSKDAKALIDKEAFLQEQ